MWAAPGDLDTSYDGDGIAFLSFGPGNDYTRAAALQKDGKLVCVGAADLQPRPLAVARFNLDGSLDTTFSDDGRVITSLTSSNSGATSVAIQSDGKIVVGGSSHNGTNSDFAVVRYNPDGSLDPSFGAGGIVITPVTSSNDYSYGMAIQSDGKIVLGGITISNSTLVRYLPDGSLDSTFGDGGKVFTRIGLNSQFSDVLLQQDGKIIGVGCAYRVESHVDFAMARYNVDGSLDTSFGTGGTVITTMSTNSDQPFCATIQPDQKILLAGRAYNGDDTEFNAARYNADGSLDTSFDDDGMLLFHVGDGSAGVMGIGVQEDGKILLTGNCLVDGIRRIVLARRNADGSVDPSFQGGSVITTIGSSSVGGSALLTQCDGRIIVMAGIVYGDVAVLRYENDWLPPPDISVEETSGMELVQGDGPEFNCVRIGQDLAWTFIVRNSGGTNLSGLSASLDGAHSGDFTVQSPLVTSLAPYETNAWLVTFSPEGSGDRGATLRIASNDPDENPFDITLHGTGISALEAWRMVHFGCITNQGIGADVFDCEKDGIPNLMEFALNSDPRQYGPCPTTLITSVPGFLYYFYSRNKDAIGEVAFFVEWSDTLMPNDWHTDGVSEFVIPGGNESSDLIEAIIPAGPGPARFVRLRVTRP